MQVPSSNAGTGGMESDLHGSKVGQFAKDPDLVKQAILGGFAEIDSRKGSSQIAEVPHDVSLEENKGERREDELAVLLQDLPQKREEAAQTLAQNSARGSKNSSKNRNASSSSRGPGRPKKSEDEKAKKAAGNANRKAKHDKIVEEAEALMRVHPNPVAVPVQFVPEKDDYERRLAHGVVKQMKDHIEKEQSGWMRTKTLGVFERGMRAMNDEEMQDLSNEWLGSVFKESYLAAISNRASEEFATVQKNYSPVDHINLIFQLLPGTVTNSESLYPLAWSFWEQA